MGVSLDYYVKIKFHCLGVVTLFVKDGSCYFTNSGETFVLLCVFSFKIKIFSRFLFYYTAVSLTGTGWPAGTPTGCRNNTIKDQLKNKRFFCSF